jgi:SH3-like domain-containing protein
VPKRPAFLAALLLGLATAAVALAPGPGQAEERPPPGVAPPTGLPVPRFVTLRSAEANMRTGPGTRYPVEWVFVRKDIPVEITAEFDTWRRIRDWEGTEGWVHQSMLSGKRSAVVLGEVRSLRRSPSPGASVVARAEAGVIGKLKRCQGEWCELDLAGYDGWLRRSDFWGTYQDEPVED